jgi:hypothetical protein
VRETLFRAVGWPCRLKTIACLLIALPVPRSHCSHCWGLVGWWSACRSSPVQIGHRPCCCRSSRSVTRLTGGGAALRRRAAQYPARVGMVAAAKLESKRLW